MNVLRKCRVYYGDDGGGVLYGPVDHDDEDGDYYRAFDVDREIERLTREMDEAERRAGDHGEEIVRLAAKCYRLRAALDDIAGMWGCSIECASERARAALRGAELRNRETPTVVGTGPCQHPFKVHYTRGDGETGITCATCAASLQEPKP